MFDDPIVAEIRAIRREHTERFRGDLHAICEDLRRGETAAGRRSISMPPRAPEEFSLICKPGEHHASEEIEPAR